MSGAAADIAVIGMSCRFPGVHDLGEFWRLLLDGRSTVGTFPVRRAVASTPISHPDTATMTSGSFFDSIDGFDAEFFGTGSAEATAMDPAQRLGLELAWEAVEDARVSAGALAGREIDVLVGAGPSGYDVLRRQSGSDRDDHYAALGSSGALIANRISSLFDVRGMSFCADSGQSSALVSLALACERIRGGAVDMALVGGVNLIVDPEEGLGLANLGALSPDGRCFTFDERASGFVRGEGGGFALLKRLDLAVADSDHIYGVVRGWGVGSGGASSRMPDPSPDAQAATVLSALRRAAVSFDGVDYVEAHGTGTRLGDPAEISGLREVFRATGRRHPGDRLGEDERRAPGVGRRDRRLHQVRPLPRPRSPGSESELPVSEPRHPGLPGGLRSPPRRAALVQRAGQATAGRGVGVRDGWHERARDPRRGPQEQTRLRALGEGAASVGVSGVVPWVLSARSEPALREQAARLRDRVAADTSLSTADVGYSLVSTRSSFAHRAVLLSGGREESLVGLDLVAAGENSVRVIRGVAEGPTPGPVVFVFPGQGSQWAGMGRRLYAESAVFARGIDDCAMALAPWTDWSLVDALTGAEWAASTDRVDVVQPMLFAVMVSLARVWQSLGVVPEAVVGHSQGEIAAACVSGALSLDDAARIVALRSRCLTELATLGGGMSAVSASPEWVRDRLGAWSGRLSTAAVNGPESVVISGDDDALEEFAERAAGERVRVRRVNVGYASHSNHVERIRDRVLADLAGISPRKTPVEFHSTVTGELLDPHALDGPYWYDNLRSMVRFGEVVENLMRERGGVFVEVSPHPVLQVAMEEAADSLAAAPLVVGTLHKDDGSAGKVLASLAELHVRGVPVNWEATFLAHRPRRIDLPTYPFQRQRYWLTAPEESDTTSVVAGVRTADLGSEAAVLHLVYAETALVLGRKAADPTGADLAARGTDTFKELGFDSSMAVRLRNRLTAAAGVRLPATVAFSYPTPRTLGHHIFSLLEPEAPDVPQTLRESSPENHSDDELYELIDRGYV